MGMNEHDSLVALEYLMDEFFNPLTNNSRKHEIEQQLQSFKCSPHLWKLCLYFLTNTSSQYVTMFALSTLETVINQQWRNTEWSCKEELKNFLQNYLVEKGSTAPYFIRGKYAKLLVTIAKYDWPTRYPDFFNNILELLKSEPNQLIGLILLRTTSEEFMGVNASFENGRKDEITRLVHQYIPIVFQLLNSILVNLISKPRHTVTATPPPSPTHPTTAPTLTQQLATATFKPDNKALNKEALDTVQHLFTWVAINQIPPTIIKAIFNFTSISSYAQDDHDMCVLAMSTINELLYRKCTPPGSQEFFIQLYFYTLELLRDITCSTTCRIDTLDPVFTEKLSELLILIVEQHLWRLEMEPGFSALEFLSLLYQLTIQLPSIQCYLRCLTIWGAFFKQIKPEKSQKYSEAFLGLLEALLKKIQFSSNNRQLEDINNVDINDDNETDWQIFLKTSIEIIAMITEQIPIETLNHVIIPWENTYAVYRRIEMIVDQQNAVINCDPSETEKLCQILDDFTTLTQTLARLSQYFLDPGDEDVVRASTPVINNLVKKLVESASLAANLRFYNLKTSRKLNEIFINNHSQLLAAIKTILPWISTRIDLDNCRLIIEITLPLIDATIPEKINNSAAHLFLSLSNIINTTDIVLLPNITQFITISTNLQFTNQQTNLIIYSAIVNLLLKTWDERIVNDKQNHKNYLIDLFFDTLTMNFRNLNNNTTTITTNEDRTREIIDNTLTPLSHIVDFCKSFSNTSKRRLYLSLKQTIEHAILLLPQYARSTDISNCILIFFLNVLRVLQQQIGIDGTRKAVEVFLAVAVKEQEAGNFLDKLLQIFQLVIESPGASYKNFLPGILQLCMDNVYPYILSHNTNPDAFIALLTLLHSILLHRWQYFYSSQVRLGYSPVYNEPEADTPEPTQLLVVLQVFGQGLLQDDINIFKLSLASLEDLNAKWKLYLNVLYRYNNLTKYLTVLLQNLIDKSQCLLNDDIQIAIYNMACINFDYFFTTFLRNFLQTTLTDLSNDQKEILLNAFVHHYDKDMPTFVRHLQVFVNDVQHYRLCSSRPTGFIIS